MAAELVSLALFYLHHQSKLSNTVPARPPNAAKDREQSQLFCSHALRTSSPAHTPPEPALRCSSVKVRGSQSQVLHRTRGWNSSALTPQGWLICAFAIRTSSTVLPRQGTGLILPDATASSPALMILGPALPTATEGMIGGRHYPHAFSTSWQMSGQGSSSLHVPLGPLTSTQSLGIALLCCSREVQGQLSRVLQPMKGRVSSPDSHM